MHFWDARGKLVLTSATTRKSSNIVKLTLLYRWKIVVCNVSGIFLFSFVLQSVCFGHSCHTSRWRCRRKRTTRHYSPVTHSFHAASQQLYIFGAKRKMPCQRDLVASVVSLSPPIFLLISSAEAVTRCR